MHHLSTANIKYIHTHPGRLHVTVFALTDGKINSMQGHCIDVLKSPYTSLIC